MAELLRIQALGDLNIQLGEEPVDDLGTRKAEALLVYLAGTQRSVAREVLAELLWEDRAPGQALGNLRVALSGLRKQLGEHLQITRESAALDPQAPLWYDAAELEHGLESAREAGGLHSRAAAEAAAQALDLYRGEFLEGFYLREARGFNEWCSQERERLQRLAVGGLHDLAAYELRCGAYADGIEHTARLLALDPLNESGQRLLMQLLAFSGRRAEALAQYESCRALLADELGVEPAAATRALYEQLLAGKLARQEAALRHIRGYELLEQIGSGGYGAVYRAYQPTVEREVAVKVILPQYANDPQFIRRFEAEAQLVARLEHPHIVPLYDYWREPDGAYLVMRLYPGGSLQQRLEAGPLELPQAAELLEQVAAGLAAAHQQGVVHRDLKPANILLDEAGGAYLSDFGIAKVLDQALAHSHPGELLGSPVYSSPEQLRSEPVTAQSDIYSLGVLLYQLLTGRTPFAESSLAELVERQLTSPLPCVRDAQPGCPPGVDAVIQRATAKDPGARFPDALALAEAFRRAAGGAAAGSDELWVRREALLSNPYKGLRAFYEADAADFFGREALTERLLARLGEAGPYQRFLAVVGPSGSGKSSVVRAGLVPALRAGALPGSADWYVVEMLPGSRPFDELEIQLLEVAARADLNLHEQLRRDAYGLTRAVRLALPGEGGQLLLVIDQFEELFTLAHDPEQTRRFLEGLYTAVTEPRSPLRVVITLRADFYDRPLLHSDFAALIQERTEVVLPLSPAELVAAICGPAERVGVRYEEGLEALIVGEVAEQPGSLPLLQYALTELFEQRQDHHLTRAAYEAIGGVAGALGRRAEGIYQSLEANEQAAARQVFLRLVTLGEGVEDTRRRVRRSELEALALDRGQSSPAVERVLQAFGTARLLAFDRDPQTRGPTVEVAHEALLREWSRLREWLDESRADLRLQRALGEAAGEWQANGREPSFLLRGARLQQFDGWAQATSLALTGGEQAYLQASLADEADRRARREQLERRSRTFLRALVAVFALAAVVAGILAVYASNQRNLALVEANSRATQQVIAEEKAAEAEAESLARATQQALAESETRARAAAEQQALQERDEARRQAAIGLAGQAELLAGGADPQLALLLALEAVGKYPYTWQAERALGQAVLQHHLLWEMYYFPYCYPSPDGARLACGWQDITILDTRNGEQLLTFSAYPEGQILDMDWSPAGDRIAAAAPNTALKVFDARTGEELLSLPGDGGEYLSWSPDGSRLLSMYRKDYDSAQVYDAASGAPLFELPGEYGYTRFASWSPDGSRIITSSCLVFDGESGQLLRTLADCNKHLTTRDPMMFTIWKQALLWSPDGTRFAAGMVDGTPGKVWDVASGEVLYEFSGHDQNVSLYWSPDGARILTVENRGSQAKVWDADSGEELYTIPGVKSGSAAWSPDGQRLVTQGEPGWISLRAAATGAELLSQLTDESEIWIFWAADGRSLLISGAHGMHRLWDVSDAILPIGCLGDCPFNPGVSYIPPAAWSPDGLQVARGFWEFSVRIYDAATRQEVARLEPSEPFNPSEYLKTLQWSPQGDLLLGRGLTQFRVWELASGEERFVRRPYTEGPFKVLGWASWSPDQARIASCGNDQGATLWDTISMSPILAIADEPCAYGYWSPDGSRILFGVYAFQGISDAGRATIRDAETGEVLLDLYEPDFPHSVWEAIWSPDGSRAVTFTTDGIARIWDASSGEELLRFNAGKEVFPAYWFPDGQRLLVTDAESQVKIYSAQTGDELLSYDCEGLCQAHLSPDGQTIGIAYWQSEIGVPFTTLSIWPDLRALQERAHSMVFRQLTPQEREQFGLPPE